jgi:hypothetical protein
MTHTHHRIGFAAADDMLRTFSVTVAKRPTFVDALSGGVINELPGDGRQ